MLPHYKTNNPPPKLADKGHAGLWFERFFDRYDQNWEIGKDVKQPWLTENFGDQSKKYGDHENLEQTAMRQLDLLQNLDGQAQIYDTHWHFITGMGNPHPIENGLNWHPTLGIPYLTGASVKGIVRSWLEVWEPKSNQSEQKKQLLQWFGSDHKDPKKQEHESLADQLIFFDAIPIQPVTLQIDIMTPHMGKWYEQGAEISNINSQPERIPADWHNPVPIPFLVVKQAQFLFSIAKRNTSIAQEIEMDKVLKALESALQWLGAGAKTAVGYGQMQRNDTALHHLKNQVEQHRKNKETIIKRQKMTPFELELDEMIAKADNPPVELLKALDLGHWQNPDEQLIVAVKAKKLWEIEKKWIPSFSGTNKQKVKQRERCLALEKYIQ